MTIYKNDVLTWSTEKSFKVEEKRWPFLIGDSREGIIRVNTFQFGDEGSQLELSNTLKLINLVQI